MMDSQTTGRVTLFPDGKYRWIYEVNLFKNASTFYDFASVRKVKAVPHRDLIKVNELLTKNRIFVDAPEDYEFVLDYIRKRCPRVNKN